MTVLSAEPQLYVTDMEAALAHWGRLGFETVLIHGEPPFYAQVRRGGAALNLRHVDVLPISDDARRREPDLLSATVTVDDAAALFAEFEAAGMSFHQPLRTESWGARTFILADPDGGLVLFAG